MKNQIKRKRKTQLSSKNKKRKVKLIKRRKLIMH